MTAFRFQRFSAGILLSSLTLIIGTLAFRVFLLQPGPPPTQLSKPVAEKKQRQLTPSVASSRAVTTPAAATPAVPPTHDPRRLPCSRSTIFVVIAAYRDRGCKGTLDALFDMAANKGCVFVGLADQRDLKNDPPCYDENRCSGLGCLPVGQVQVTALDVKNAKGPVFGRYVAAQMYRGESYVMALDSHSRFVHHWDLVALRLHAALPSKKAVLTHYPEAWYPPEEGAVQLPLSGRRTTSYLCKATFVRETGIFKMEAMMTFVNPSSRLQPWAAAGFLFGPAAWLKEVPFDPFLDYLFDGEEMLLTLRLWTSGWDLYSPAENIAFHHYRRKAPNVFADTPVAQWEKAQRISITRLRFIIGLQVTEKMRILPRVQQNLTQYGLGSARTMAEYEEFSGLNIQRRTSSINWCQRAMVV